MMSSELILSNPYPQVFIFIKYADMCRTFATVGFKVKQKTQNRNITLSAIRLFPAKKSLEFSVFLRLTSTLYISC